MEDFELKPQELILGALLTAICIAILIVSAFFN